MRNLYILTLAVALLSCSRNTSDNPTYKDAERPVEERVSDLLKRMTLSEKIAQMYCAWQTKNQLLLDSTGHFDAEKARKNFKDGLGQVGRPSDTNGGLDPYETALLTNAIQKYFVEETRLGIPV